MRPQQLEAAELVDKACEQLGYNLSELIGLVSIWIDPEIVHALTPVDGVWYPKRRRANLGLRVEGKQIEEVGQEIDGIILDSNTYANTCFKAALGIFRKQVVGFHVCHIWPHTAYDPRCFTQLANLVAIPRELASLTDHHPHIVACLKFRSWELYRWKPDKELPPVEPRNYPKTWRPPFPANDNARRCVRRRLGISPEPKIAGGTDPNEPEQRQPSAAPDASFLASSFEGFLKSDGFVDVRQTEKRFFSAVKDGKTHRFAVRTARFSNKRNGWSYTFYDTSDRFDDSTELVALMLSDADSGTLRNEILVISPAELRQQFKARKTWFERLGCNRFDLTIQRDGADKWRKWIIRLAEIR